MNLPWPAYALSLVLMVATAACSELGDPPVATVTETDSLGIVVRTYGHSDNHLENWSLDPEPVLELGALEGDTPDVFGRITSLKITADGGVVVGDALAGELRSFSTASEHLGSVGGLGEGPGEFSNSVSLLRVSGDSIWAWDQRQQRVSIFVHGEFTTSWSIPGESSLSRAVLVGSKVFGQSNVRSAGIPATGMNRPSVGFAVVEEDGFAATLFETAGHERFLDIQQANGQITGVRVFQAPFARGSFFGVVGPEVDPRVVGGPNDRFVLHEWSQDGGLRAIHRYPDMDRRVTPALIERARQRIIERHEEPTPGLTQELATFDANVPTFVPAFDRVWSDDEERLWLRRSAVDRVEEWLVLALPDLSPLAQIVLPAGFALMDVRDGLLGGYWLDEFDVSYARLYRLRVGS